MARKKKVKDVKPEEVKKEELVEETEVKEVETEEVETKEEVVSKEEDIENLPPKEAKKRRFVDEVKAFFILLLIVGLVVLAGVLFYKYAEPIKDDDTPENKVVETDEYKSIVYSTSLDNGKLELYGDKYLIETDGEYLVKIMNNYSETLYEAIDEESYYFALGIDGNLYAYEDEMADYSNVLNLYVLENDKLVHVKEFNNPETYYKPMYYYDENYERLLVGIEGNCSSMDEDLNEVIKTSIYSIDGTNHELLNYYSAFNYSIESNDFVEVTDTRYIIVRDLNGKYGLYDLETSEIIIDASYSGLYNANDGNYVAVKNGKAGIINKKLKKLVDFKYDFIDVNDGYYVVSKDKKLALMNDEHELITDFVFDYQAVNGDYDYSYYIYALDFNSFISYEVNDKYVLTINNRELDGVSDYAKSETYIINKDGKYETIEGNMFIYDELTGLAYSYLKDDRKVVIYDAQFKEKYSLSYKDYDFDGNPYVDLRNGNTIEVILDSSLYYDYETGEEIESIKDVTYEIGKSKLEYDVDAKKVKVIVNEEEIVTFKYDVTKNVSNVKPYKTITEENFNYIDGTLYVYVEKR